MTVRWVVVGALLACVACKKQPAAESPAPLDVPAGQRVALKAHGQGTQIYVCKAASAGAAPAWTLKEPRADLLDPAGAVIGKHYAGPTWESTDGSRVVGAKKQSVESPDGAIPWLLLQAASTSGSGVFTHVTWIQRLATQAGRAPADGCDAAHDGAETAVPYQATYVFYQPAS